MARPPAPTNIKMLKGDPNKNRLNSDFIEGNKLVDIPEPPMKLNSRAIEFFNRYCRILIVHDLLTDFDTMQLCHLAMVDEWCESCHDQGAPATASYIALSKSISSDFGLNVLAREKIKPPAKKEEGNKWAKNKKVKK